MQAAPIVMGVRRLKKKPILPIGISFMLSVRMQVSLLSNVPLCPMRCPTLYALGVRH